MNQPTNQINQPTNQIKQPTNQPTKELTEGGDLSASTTWRPSVSLAIPALQHLWTQ